MSWPCICRCKNKYIIRIVITNHEIRRRNNRTTSAINPIIIFLFLSLSNFKQDNSLASSYFSFSKDSISLFLLYSSYFICSTGFSPFFDVLSDLDNALKYFFISSTHIFEAFIDYYWLFDSITDFIIVFFTKFINSPTTISHLPIYNILYMRHLMLLWFSAELWMCQYMERLLCLLLSPKPIYVLSRNINFEFIRI